MKRRAGHVQAAFERRTGRTMESWLLEFGPHLSGKAAAEAIGYARPGALRTWVELYMPADFAFRCRRPALTEQQLIDAIIRKARGETWRKLGAYYGCSYDIMRDRCRRYLRRRGIPA